MAHTPDTAASLAASPEPIAEAMRLLRRDADSLREGHTLHCDRDDWTGEEDAKAGFDEYLAAIAGLEALAAAPVEQPISTAPRDGRRILLHPAIEVAFGHVDAADLYRELFRQTYALAIVELDAGAAEQPAGEYPAPFGYVNTQTGQFFTDVEESRKHNEGYWRTVYADASVALRASRPLPAQATQGDER